MRMGNISITSTGGPDPETLDTTPGSSIHWTNNNSATVNSFTLPTCVSPQTSPAPIAPGATTRDYTVNTNGDFGYSYEIDGTSYHGTIDVG